MLKIFKRDIFFVTLITFVLIYVLYLIPLDKLSFLNPISQTLSDFDLHDITFSQLRNEPLPDTNIVIVNIGNLTREGIAAQIAKINQYNPKVIGLDIFFYDRKDSLGDLALSEELSRCKNLVMVNRVDEYDHISNSYRKVVSSDDIFDRFASLGFANLPDESGNSFRTIRRFMPFVKSKDSDLMSFACKVAEKANPTAVEELKKRGNELEIINYRGNYQKFYFLDAADIFIPETDLSFLKNKIVLLGFMGQSLDEKTFSDMFFTPLNKKYSGKTFPDMYGIVIHANIISMILNRSYINCMRNFETFLIAFIVVYLNAMLLMWLKRKRNDWFGAMTKGILFFQSILYLYFSIIIFTLCGFKVSITLVTAGIFLTTTSMDLYDLYIKRVFLIIKKNGNIKTDKNEELKIQDTPENIFNNSNSDLS